MSTLIGFVILAILVAGAYFLGKAHGTLGGIVKSIDTHLHDFAAKLHL